jgi:uncharacterized membrane protein YheB (UPF0754 family)
MINYFLFLLPVINALFGWFVADFFLLLLFRPYDKIKIAGITLHGILPSIQNEIAKQVGEWAQQNFSGELLEEILLSEKSRKEYHELFEAKADDFIRHKLTERISLLKMFITEGIIIQAKEVLIEELDRMLPEMVKNFAPKTISQMNLAAKIEKRISLFPLQHLEKEMQVHFQKKIFWLKMATALAGFLVGAFELGLIIY